MPYRRLKSKINEKVHRNQMIADYHRDHPNVSHEDIGKIFGITRARIGMILRTLQRRLEER